MLPGPAPTWCYMWLTGLWPSPPRPGWPESCMPPSPTTPETFSSSRRFRHAAFGLRLRSGEQQVRSVPGMTATPPALVWTTHVSGVGYVGEKGYFHFPYLIIFIFFISHVSGVDMSGEKGYFHFSYLIILIFLFNFSFTNACIWILEYVYASFC